MNDGAPQLLGSRHVALVERTWEDVHLGAPVTFVPWADSAFWPYGTLGHPQVSLDRVSATEEPSLEFGRPGADIQRSLRRDALPDCCCQAMGDERAGAGRPLLSKKQETEWT